MILVQTCIPLLLASLAKLKGLPVDLYAYEASDVLTSKHMHNYKIPSDFERIYLPHSMAPFTAQEPLNQQQFLIDDNRSATSSIPSVTMDGTEYYLSIKGIGSATNPFSHELFTKTEIVKVLNDPRLVDKIINLESKSPRYITGELWLRGSPYGGQGLQHATVSLKISEMADLTSIHGFRIAPLVNIVCLPEAVENRIKQFYWYRQFRGRIVQETRLVPSNVRVYFHSGSTIGGNISSIFQLFNVDSDDKALDFLKNFVKSGIAYLTLFVRSIQNNSDGTYSGLDFYDVWLDKDAVLAPDGTIHFVDLEGLEWITIPKDRIQEKITDQIYRSLYEFLYAYEQIERERTRRFETTTERKMQFENTLREALKNDEVVGLNRTSESLELAIGNILHDDTIIENFPIIDYR